MYFFIDSEKPIITRRCYPEKDKDGCTKVMGGTDCFCNSDKCNGATGKWISKILITLLLFTIRM